MTTSKKRSSLKDPVEGEADKRARTDAGAVVASGSAPSSAATAMASSTPSASGAAATQKPISLPKPSTVAEGASDVVTYLNKINSVNEENEKHSHPVIIGSRAAAYWMPSFRACDDWDIVATPNQAIKIIKDTQASSNLSIKLIVQPLDTSVIRRKPLPQDVKQAMVILPKHLYKITAENKATHIKFEIEIAVQDHESTGMSSASQILKLCEANGDDTSYMTISLGSGKGIACMVAPVSLLEALKSSHIYWPAYFAKHIADLHTLRAVLAPLEPPSSTANIGIFADKGKPLTPPTRSPQMEELLLARTLEVEAFRGTPGAHINLNMSNQDFLDREDDLFVTRHIPHDDVHAMVMYHDTPIYDELKTDKSKAMVSKDLFEKASYEKQIQCVKEEAMVIALERFLLPKVTLDPVSAYRSALLRICTTLTKGWFRQFAVDNFPRLAVCDKNLLSIRDDILTKHPLPPAFRHDPLNLLRKTITNLDDLHLMKQLSVLTEEVSDIDDDWINSDVSDEDDMYDTVYTNPSRGEELYRGKRFWAIDSAVPENPGLLVSFYNEDYCNGPQNCILNFNFHGTLSVQLLTTSNVDLKHLSAFESSRYGSPEDYSEKDFHKLAVAVCANNQGGSWGGGEIWSTNNIIARSLKEEVNVLGIEGLTEDLLMAYIIAVVQPELPSNGDTPLRNTVNELRVKGAIPVSPVNHLWFDYWKYHDLID